MKTSSLFRLIASGAFLLVLSVGCKKNAATPNTCETASRRAEEYTAAVQTWAADPTNRTKCQAALKAANDFISAADNCSTIPQADINAARQSLSGFNCQ
ncbi:MAG: hypothetical protein MUD08_11865 [Cytophagales bacterium]|nr:hypothetical protein [Cytophagales bacterium]